MGGQESTETLCSTSRPGGYEREEAKVPLSLNCSSAQMAMTKNLKVQSCLSVENYRRNEYSQEPMQVATKATLQKDRINAWTRDIEESSCGGFDMMCGGPAVAPSGYLADTQADGVIVLDAFAGPMWRDEDLRVVQLEPDESGPVVDLPRATRQDLVKLKRLAAAQAGPDRLLLRGGRSVQPGGATSRMSS
eukprot:CAMPEP_0170616030 /NCGR_PEP_ID=MMETSP0224-20130122/25655_1 /TAXON_ID=285029 /ORGANISM="Togula jolla, Strain CCCM 725" /LENGTH=190 /DNA_ID=CAMNT_0010941805 /DNA_START=71 /DNA_END=643 /DNA_ORIENTATION=+